MKKIKLWKKIVVIVLAVLIMFFGAFFIYVSDYYKADNQAIDLNKTLVDKGDLSSKDDMLIFSPEKASNIGLIFYPGAKVEEIAYTPLLNKLREEGLTCVMIEMPFHMAIFNSDAADDIYDNFSEIDTWYICGHSMGGGMASSYVSNNPDSVEGLILLGAYIYGDVSAEDALTIYGTFNSNLEENIDYEENIVIIEGGNHAQFGNYGKQKGDPDATITAEEQQNITVDAILDFIDERE